MIVEQVVKGQEKEILIQCKLCHNDIGKKPIIKRLGAKFGVICRDCSEQFSDQEIELMANMFLAFGGHFNQYQTPKERQQQIITEVAGEYLRKEQTSAKLKSDVKTLHRAFLNGISLAQLTRGINRVIE
jgi:hypothetical protein